MRKTSKVDHHHTDELSMERIVFFSDAVFAIAITLLALEIRLPEIVGLDSAELLRELLSIWPKYLSFMVSFLVIGNFWLIHHRQFCYIERYDTRLIFINLFVLMAIAFIPFPTVVISENGNRTATIFYAMTMCAVGLLLTLLWLYASSRRRLVSPNLDTAIVRRGILRNLSAPAVFFLSIGVAYINPDLAKFSWILITPAVFLVK
jgi:uncharacterized membrane protein